MQLQGLNPQRQTAQAAVELLKFIHRHRPHRKAGCRDATPAADDWLHKVQLEKVLPFNERISLPLCLRGRRACPLENVGGTPGYKAFLATFSDPGQPGHAELLAWIEGQFDPEHFEAREANDALGEYCR